VRPPPSRAHVGIFACFACAAYHAGHVARRSAFFFDSDIISARVPREKFLFDGRDQQQYPSSSRARACLPVNPCRFGFDVAHYREITPRQERGSPIPGQLMALVKRGAGGQQEERHHQEQGGDAGGEL